MTTFISLSFVFIANTFAQEPQTPSEEQTEQPQEKEQTESDTDTPNADADERVSGDGGFIPSEEISEDLSVSFPIDI